MAEQSQMQESLSEARRASPALESPVLSRYARLASAEEEVSPPPTVDVPSKEVPSDLGPANLSPVERLPAPPPAVRPPPKKSPFWKRIALPRAQDPPVREMPVQPKVSLEPVLARLQALEEQITANHRAADARLEQFEENLTRLWEIEDQIAQTELRERLAVFEANQEEIADGLHAVSRNLVVLASVLGTTLAAGALVGVFLL